MHYQAWTGSKTRLRAITLNDLDAYLADRTDSDSARHSDEINLPQHPAALRKRIEAQSERKGDDIWLAITDLDNNLVGGVDVHGSDRRHRVFEYGLFIFREHRRQGYAREAVALILRFYFQELGYHRAWATVYSFNRASLALHQAMGFREEGRLRESLYTQGRYWDEVVFGLLHNEAQPLIDRLPPLPAIDPA